MTTISHRELRNNSAAILRRVASGETFEITNHGITTAVLSPAVGSTFDRLVAAGKVRPATDPDVDLRAIERRTSSMSSEEILRDVRGEW